MKRFFLNTLIIATVTISSSTIFADFGGVDVVFRNNQQKVNGVIGESYSVEGDDLQGSGTAQVFNNYFPAADIYVRVYVRVERYIDGAPNENIEIKYYPINATVMVPSNQNRQIDFIHPYEIETEDVASNVRFITYKIGCKWGLSAAALPYSCNQVQMMFFDNTNWTP